MILSRIIKKCFVASATSLLLSLVFYITWTSETRPRRRLMPRQGQKVFIPHQAAENVYAKPVEVFQSKPLWVTDADEAKSGEILEEAQYVDVIRKGPNLEYSVIQPDARQYEILNRDCLPAPDIENVTQLAKLRSCHVVFYNRAPKCGSRSVLSTFKALGNKLGYTVHSEEKPDSRSFFTDMDLLEPFTANFTTLSSPFIYAQHLHFVDFEKYGGHKPPVYVNVIRDPVEGLISHYFFKTYGSSNQHLTSPKPVYNMSLAQCVSLRLSRCMNLHWIVPYFCGHRKECRENNAWSLQRALYNVEKSYLAVGLTEDIHAFMEVIEFLLPNFFSNASKVFLKLETAFKARFQTAKKHDVPAITKSILKSHLRYEYDFYYFIQRRFYTILSKVRKLKGQSTNVREPIDVIDKILS